MIKMETLMMLVSFLPNRFIREGVIKFPINRQRLGVAAAKIKTNNTDAILRSTLVKLLLANNELFFFQQ
jgi:hypothetical protein